jgi:hypothetical protein
MKKINTAYHLLSAVGSDLPDGRTAWTQIYRTDVQRTLYRLLIIVDYSPVFDSGDQPAIVECVSDAGRWFEAFEGSIQAAHELAETADVPR